MARDAVALVLAAGRGTRMRRTDDGAALTSEQMHAASNGLKAMMPDRHGRPMLDHVLTALADAGLRDVGIVVPSDHEAMRIHLDTLAPTRTRTTLIVQDEPTGTAHAVLSAESWAAGRGVVVLNADNLYATDLLGELAALDVPGCAAFDPAALVANSNFDAGRIAAFARLDVDRAGMVRGIIEKPSPADLHRLAMDAPVSMNLWRFDTSIFDACRRVTLSPRGEYELPDAVALAVRSGTRMRAIRTRSGVLDLSARGDVASVAAALADRVTAP